MDTATPVTSVAVGSDAGTLASVAVRHERRHAELLTPAVRWVLEQAELDPGSLGGVAVGVGPGLFTGLRVGVSTAKALAQAWQLPMVAVPRPDQLAAAIEGRREDVLLCGDGAFAYREVFERLGDRCQFGGQADAMPSAGALIELALPRFLREEFSSPLDVTPLYLRRPDVDPSAERRLAAERTAGAGGSGASSA